MSRYVHKKKKKKKKKPKNKNEKMHFRSLFDSHAAPWWKVNNVNIYAIYSHMSVNSNSHVKNPDLDSIMYGRGLKVGRTIHQKRQETSSRANSYIDKFPLWRPERSRQGASFERCLSSVRLRVQKLSSVKDVRLWTATAAVRIELATSPPSCDNLFI